MSERPIQIRRTKRERHGRNVSRSSRNYASSGARSRGSNGSQRKQNHETRRDINAGTRRAGCTFVWIIFSVPVRPTNCPVRHPVEQHTVYDYVEESGPTIYESSVHELAHLWEFVTRSFDIRSCPGISAIVYYAIHEHVVTPTRRTDECFAINRCDTADPSISICYRYFQEWCLFLVGLYILCSKSFVSNLFPNWWMLMFFSFFFLLIILMPSSSWNNLRAWMVRIFLQWPNVTLYLKIREISFRR